MPSTIDLSSRIGDVTFKNPIISGASSLAYNLEGVQRLIKAGVGGITSKTHTTVREVTRRPRPYQMPLGRFGEGFAEGGSLLTMECPDPFDLDMKIKEELPRMAGECRKANIPFIISFFCHFNEPEEWAEYAVRFERTGADMLELNFSCPEAKRSVQDNWEVTAKIVELTSAAVKCPVGPKIGPEIEPLERLSGMWVSAGAQFITAHNVPNGIMIDIENETPFGFPNISGYVPGRSFIPISLARIIRIKQSLDIPIIGAGGIYNGSDALQYILSGCPVVLICGAVFLRGTKVIKDAVEQVSKWMQRKDYKSIKQFEGKIPGLLVEGSRVKNDTQGVLSVPPNVPYVPRINHELCTACGDCWTSCNAQAIRYDKRKKKVAVNNKRCWGCGLCQGLCKREAIKLINKNDNETVWDAGEGLPRPFKDLATVIR